MADPKTIDQLAEELSYGQEEALSLNDAKPHFLLRTGAKYLAPIDSIDDSNVLAFINGFKDWDSFDSLFATIKSITLPITFYLDNTATQIAQLAGIAANVLTVNLEQATRIAENAILTNKEKPPVLDLTYAKTNVTFFTFSTTDDLPVKILENGIGASFQWVKFAYSLPATVSGQEPPIRIAYCLRNDLLRTANANKLLITTTDNLIPSPDEFDRNTATDPKLTPKNLYSSIIPSLGDLNKVKFDENLASYYTVVEVDTINIAQLDENNKREVLKNAFYNGVKLVAKENNKGTESRFDNKDYQDAYYLFGKIQTILISPRPRQKPLMLVIVPYRNIESVGTIPTDLASIGSAILNTITEAPQVINSAVNTVNNALSFDINQSAPALSALLGVGGGGNGVPTDLFAPTPSLKYVSRQQLETLSSTNPSRIVAFPLKELKAISNTISQKLQKVQEEFNKKLNDYEEDEAPDTFINLFDYSRAFEINGAFVNSILAILEANNISFTRRDGSGNVTIGDDGTIIFSFNGYSVADIVFLKQLPNGTQQPILLKGTFTTLSNDPFTNLTFSFLLCNALSIREEPDETSFDDFLSKYVAPQSLSQVIYKKASDVQNQKSKSCLKSFKENLKEQAKSRSNEFVTNLGIQESKKNYQATISKPEWEKTKKNIENLFNNRAKQLLPASANKKDIKASLKTIQWEYVIDEAVKCIEDQATRELIRQLLLTILKATLDDTPLACLLPVVNLPRFPVIKLPRFPNLPSLATAYYAQFDNTLANIRERALKQIIKTFLEFINACDNNVNPENLGTNPDSMLQNPASTNLPLLNLGQQDTARQQQYLTNGIIGQDDQNKEETYQEIRKILFGVSEILTKDELMSLFLGVATPEVLNLAKNQINFLEIQPQEPIVKIPATLGTIKRNLNLFNSQTPQYTILSDTKVIEFFKKFGNILDENAYNSFVAELNNRTSDILCIDESKLYENLSRAYQNQGLSPQDAADQIGKRNRNIQQIVANLALSLEQLAKDSITLPPLDCQVNADGTTTPGLLDELGSRPQFMVDATEKTVRGLFKQTEESYNQDIKAWFKNTSEFKYISGSDGTIEQQKLFFDDVLTQVKNNNPILNVGKFSKSSFTENYRSLLTSSFVFEKTGALAQNAPLNERSLNTTVPIQRFYIYLTSSFGTFNFQTPQKLNNANADQIALLSLQSCANINFSQLSTDLLPLQNKMFRESLSSSFSITPSFRVDSDSTIANKLNTINKLSTTYQSQKELSNIAVSASNYNFDFFRDETNYGILRSSLEKCDFYYFKEQYKQSDFFTPIKTSIIKDKNSSINSKAITLNLNPIRTKKQIKCNEKDRRLIAIFDELVQNAVNGSKNQCSNTPNIGPDGIKLEPTPTDNAMLDACIDMFLRVYAIDFNLKLLPLFHYSSLISTNSFYSKCFSLFEKDLTFNFGKTFTTKILTNIVKRVYGLTKKEEIDAKLSDKKLVTDAFISLFSEKHFKPVAKQICNLLGDSNLNKDFMFSEEQKIICKNNYASFNDYLFDNIFEFSPLKIALYEFTKAERERKQQAFDNLVNDIRKMFLYGWSDYYSRSKNDAVSDFGYNFFSNFVWSRSIETWNQTINNRDETPGFPVDNPLLKVVYTAFNKQQFITFLKANSRLSDDQIAYILDFFKLFTKKFTKIVCLSPFIVETDYINRPEICKKLSEQSLPEQEFYNSNSIDYLCDELSGIGDAYWSAAKILTITRGFEEIIKVKKELDEIEQIFSSFEVISSNLLNYTPFMITVDADKKETMFNLNYNPNSNLTLSSTIQEVKNSVKQLYRLKFSDNLFKSYKKDENFKNYFHTLVSSFLPVEEVLSIQMSSMLESMSSIQKLNSLFLQTKLQLKDAVQIVEAAGDHTKEIEDTGLNFLLSQLKVAIEIPKFMVKSMAEVTDPNIVVASAISKAYQAGVVAAEMAGVKIPVRRLPLYVTSPPLFAALLPIITPQGAAALALSYEESMFDDDSITSENDEC